MAKSKARFLAEILGSDGKVQKGKSKGFEEIALSDLPTITNAKLQNSAVTFAGETASLGGSASLNTGDISEHTNNKYFTDARSRGSIKQFKMLSEQCLAVTQKVELLLHMTIVMVQ